MEKAEIASCSRYLRARVSRLVVGVLLSGFRRGNHRGFTHAVDRRHFCVNFGGRSGVLRVGVRVPTCAPAGSERARRAGGEGRRARACGYSRLVRSCGEKEWDEY